MSGGEHVQLPPELEQDMRALESKCEARYVRPERGGQPRRWGECCNPADFVVTLTNPCGHSITEPMCSTHHDMSDAYWNAGKLIVACQGCGVQARPAGMRCELL